MRSAPITTEERALLDAYRNERWARITAPGLDLARATEILTEILRGRGISERHRVVEVASPREANQLIAASTGQQGPHWPWFDGGSWAGWLSHYVAGERILGGEAKAEDAKLRDLLAELCEVVGWVWTFEHASIVCPKPVTKWEGGPGSRLHCTDGPAVLYPDGWALYRICGVVVPRELVEGAPTAHEIAALTNAEVRRVLIERYGPAKYLRDVGAVLRGEDERGRLWVAELPGDEPLVMVEVVDATPREDGTRKTYFLRVPPDTRTAAEGVAWSFSRDVGRYHPSKET